MTEHYIAYNGLVNTSLAALNKDYIPIIMRHVNDLTVTKGILMRPPVTLEAELQWYENAWKRNETDHVFAILAHEKKEGQDGYRYIGHTGLHHISWPNGVCTSGSIIFDIDAHKKGYGTEAKLLLLYHAFFVKGLRKVSSEVKAFNGNSLGHLLKCGYQIIGRRKKHHFHEGFYVDDILLEVFREEFEPIWNLYQETKKLPQLTNEQRAQITKEIQK